MENKQISIIALIFFICGVIVGYYIQLPSAFEGITLSILGSGIIIGVIDFALKISGANNTRRIKHSEILVDKYLDFIKYNHSDINFLKDSNLDLGIIILYSNNFNSQDETYSIYVDNHIKSGYPNVWKQKEYLDNCINRHNKEAQIFFENTVEKIKNDIKKNNPTFVEYTYGIYPNENFIQPIDISEGVSKIVKDFYKKTIDLDKVLKIMSEGNRVRIQLYSHVFANSFDAEILKTIEPMIKTILKEALSSEDFKKLKYYHKDISEKHNVYAKDIDKILKNIESGNPLKGHCDNCPKFNLNMIN